MRPAQHTTIRQSTPRHISDSFNVKSIARRLGSYSYAEMRLMEAQASWIASIPLAHQGHEMMRQVAYRAAEQRLLDHLIQQADDRFGGN